MPKVVTANRLHDGVVVFLGRDRSWSEDLVDAWVVNDTQALRELEALAEASVAKDQVISTYAMDVAVVDGSLSPTSVREEIRVAHRPSV
ncbi:MAG: DUF2849 domain-containing protein [Hyphomicrobiaceae bacterium]